MAQDIDANIRCEQHSITGEIRVMLVLDGCEHPMDPEAAKHIGKILSEAAADAIKAQGGERDYGYSLIITDENDQIKAVEGRTL